MGIGRKSVSVRSSGGLAAPVAPFCINLSYSVPTDGIGAMGVVPFAARVVGIIGRVVTQGSGGAATCVVKKAPSGTAITGGTALHSGTYDFVGTATNTQTLSLTATTADLELAAGDTIGIDVTGTTTSATGCISVWCVPKANAT